MALVPEARTVHTRSHPRRPEEVLTCTQSSGVSDAAKLRFVIHHRNCKIGHGIAGAGLGAPRRWAKELWVREVPSRTQPLIPWKIRLSKELARATTDNANSVRDSFVGLVLCSELIAIGPCQQREKELIKIEFTVPTRTRPARI